MSDDSQTDGQVQEKTRFRVSVGDLVAAACTPRDLTRGSGSRQRAVEGIETHLRLQADRPEGYESEVPVSIILEQDSFDLEVFGRMDGIMASRGRVMVEEIKSCRQDPEDLVLTPDLRHLAQLKCYAYMAACERGLAAVDLRLTYARPASEKTASWTATLAFDVLAAFFEALVSAYLSLLGTRSAWERIRNQSIETLDFPFNDFRTGQRDLAEAVYKIIRHQKLLFARAPTGTGKTMGVLFPSIKALGLGLTDKIFYLTAKTPGRTVVKKALQILGSQGLRLKSVFITAKQKICFFPEQTCDMETCPYAAAYYTKLAKALTRIECHDIFDREHIETLAREFELCPFELSLDLSLSCDLIVCDLNYAFDPRVYLKRFFDRNTRNLAFLMDEAHNLPDRLRAMYSAALDRTHILEAQKILRTAAPGLGKGLARIQRQMMGLAKTCAGSATETAALDEPDQDLMEALDDFSLKADLWLDSHPESPMREMVLDIFFSITAFLNISRHFGPHYRFMVHGEPTQVGVQLLCLHPAPIFSRLIRRCSSAVFFSATFFPFPFYEQVLLGGTPDGQPAPSPEEAGTVAKKKALIPYTIALPSPFPKENFSLFIHQGIRTTFRQRSRFYQDVADAICHAATARPGNHLVFFSSYAYMDAVLALMDQEAHDIRVQTPAMDEDERQAFIDAFQPGAGILGFAVMGGIFGEGIDLTGERLIGVTVVGVGLPQVCTEQEEIRAYYDRIGLDGFFMAYQMPGFSRVLQAAGRLIRTGTDRGVALLLDERFMRPDYQDLFPAEWQGVKAIRSLEELPALFSKFEETPGTAPE